LLTVGVGKVIVGGSPASGTGCICGMGAGCGRLTGGFGAAARLRAGGFGGVTCATVGAGGTEGGCAAWGDSILADRSAVATARAACP
jgi:hypothetical protein